MVRANYICQYRNVINTVAKIYSILAEDVGEVQRLRPPGLGVGTSNFNFAHYLNSERPISRNAVASLPLLFPHDHFLLLSLSGLSLGRTTKVCKNSAFAYIVRSWFARHMFAICEQTCTIRLNNIIKIIEEHGIESMDLVELIGF